MRTFTRAGCKALERGDLAYAEAYLRDALALDANDADASAALGLTLAQAGRAELALPYLSAADGARIDVQCALGEIKLGLLDYAGAAKALARCLQLDPQGVQPHGVRARMLIKRAQRKLTEQSLR